MFAQTAKTAIALKTTTARSTRASARSTRAVAVRAASDRELWYPGAVAPEYLNGSMAGDYGACGARRARWCSRTEARRRILDTIHSIRLIFRGRMATLFRPRARETAARG